MQPHPTPSPSPHSTSTPDFDKSLTTFLTSRESAYELRSIQQLTQAYYVNLYRSPNPPLCEFLKKKEDDGGGGGGDGGEGEGGRRADAVVLGDIPVGGAKDVKDERRRRDTEGWKEGKFRAKQVVRGFEVRERE